MTRGDAAMSEADFERRGDEIVATAARSGIEGMRLLKTTGSSFAQFARDKYTSLPDLVDRPLTIRLNAHWRYDDPRRASGGIRSELIRRAIEETFHEFNSRSIQHLLHVMGTRLLNGFPVLGEVEFAAENHTPDAVTDLKGDVRVFAEPRQTFGKIGLVLRR
jgi:urate oxidase